MTRLRSLYFKHIDTEPYLEVHIERTYPDYAMPDVSETDSSSVSDSI